MAHYYTCASSDYFQVKDAEAFEAWAKSYEQEGLCFHKDDQDGTYRLYADDDRGFPYYVEREVTDEEGDIWETREIDFAGELAPHLPDGVVAILTEVGFERIDGSGSATAVKGGSTEKLEVGTWTIHELVKEKWGIETL